MEADREIQEFTNNRQLFLRTPGGEWHPKFAEALNRNDELRKYSGPVNWNIDCGDYEIGWTRHRDPRNPPYTLQLCLEECLQKIRIGRKGIVLLHDWSADPGDLGEKLQCNNRTLESLFSLIVGTFVGSPTNIRCFPNHRDELQISSGYEIKEAVRLACFVVPRCSCYHVELKQPMEASQFCASSGGRFRGMVGGPCC